MSKFSLARAAVLGVVSKARAALHRPGQQHLCRRLANSRSDCRNDWIFERPRPYAMTQWRKSQKHNVLLFAEF